jgi:hypothetical protein
MRRGISAAAAAVLACGVALAGCSNGSEEKQGGGAPKASVSASAGTHQPATRAVVATVTGRLAADRRTALAQDIAEVVDGWLDGAYLGDFPRADYAPAFAGFTAGAAARARRELALMSNAPMSDRIDKATATKRSVSLDVLSIGRRPVGVTATVDLAFATTGDLAGPQEVTGTLDLTPVGGGWKIFGYRVSRTPVPPATAPASPAATSESTS